MFPQNAKPRLKVRNILGQGLGSQTPGSDEGESLSSELLGLNRKRAGGCLESSI